MSVVFFDLFLGDRVLLFNFYFSNF